jgi:beta-1,2-mannobiose phosphorylase / 1,2-beta-oligomannan phosphorylase
LNFIFISADSGLRDKMIKYSPMIKVRKEGIILSKTDLEFENEGVLNPAAIQENDTVHIFYRSVQKGNFSTIGYCRLDGPLTVAERCHEPIMVPEFEYEKHGVEDPRIVRIEDQYYLSYTAYDGTNARGALAISKDLVHFKKQGLIVPPITFTRFISLAESAGGINEKYYHDNKFYNPHADPEKKVMLWDKNVVFFPRRIKGNLVFLHRIRPGIQIVSVKSIKDLTREFWENYFLKLHDHIVLDPVFAHESGYIGSGCPPIETENGWLLIYHGVEHTDRGYVYSACASLLDLDNPVKVIARLPYALFSPQYEWELKGEVNNVVFPTGTALFGNTLFIYYGAADTQIACASVNFSGLIAELLSYKIKNEK